MVAWNTANPKDEIKRTTREKKLPDRLEFKHDLDVVFRAMLYRRSTGELLSPEDIEAMDDDWRSDVDRMEHWFDFERVGGGT